MGGGAARSFMHMEGQERKTVFGGGPLPLFTEKGGGGSRKTPQLHSNSKRKKERNEPQPIDDADVLYFLFSIPRYMMVQ